MDSKSILAGNDPINNDSFQTWSWDLPTEMTPFLDLIGVDRGDPPFYAYEALWDFFTKKPSAQMMPNSLRKELADAGLNIDVYTKPHHIGQDVYDGTYVVGLLEDRGDKGMFIRSTGLVNSGLHKVAPESVESL